MTILKSNTTLQLIGRGSVTVRPSNYLTTGGEGSVYRLNDTIVKLFTDQEHMKKGDFSRKLKRLTDLRYDGIVSPLGIVEKNGKEIGYYMPYVDGEPLSRMFTNDFLLRNQITREAVVSTVARMRNIVSFAHDKNATLVDANELNWIVKLGGKEPLPYVIDVDSWSIDGWQGNVIMPSIRDWHAKEFDHKSDWFAWGIVTFQLFAGIHPYKGSLDGYDRGSLESRMKANASVFSKGIRLNRAVRDFSLIPKGLYAWYEATFQNGMRTPPPLRFDETVPQGTIGQIYRKVVTKSGSLTYEKLLDGPADIFRIFPSGVAALSDFTLYDLGARKTIAAFSDRNIRVIEAETGYVIAEKKNGHAVCRYIDKRNDRREEAVLPFDVRQFVEYSNRLFAVTEQGLSELSFHLFSKLVVSIRNTWNALPSSTVWHDGFGLQNALNATYLIYPYGDDACLHMRIPELDAVTILGSARGERNVSLTGLTRKGESFRYDIVFAKDMKSYAIAISHADTSDISQVTLPKGVAVEITDDGKLEVCAIGGTTRTVLEDKDIFIDARLYRRGNQVLYARLGTVYGLSMT